MAESRFDVLQTIIDEFKTMSPETTNSLVFDGEGQTVATTKATGLDQKQNLLTNFTAIKSQAKVIGGVENLTIQASNSQLNITAIEQLFLATVSSRKANPKILKSLTQVVVPSIVSLVNQNVELILRKDELRLLNPAEIKEPAPVSEETPEIETIPEPTLPFETVTPETPGNQLMVEKISDFLVSPDTVRIDGEVIAKWFSLSGGKKIRIVSIETLEGRKTLCKFKPIDELFKRNFGAAAVTIRRKDAKSSTKGIIQVPEKIILALQTNKGNLVKVKPVIDQPEE